MLLVLQHQDGRWCLPSMSDGEITEESAAKWADAVAGTLGFEPGSLTPHVVADDADPRTGDLISEPVPDVLPPLEAEPTPFAQLVEALQAEPALSQQTKAAIAQIAGGAEIAVQIPLAPKP